MAKHKVTFDPAGVTVEVSDELYPYGSHGAAGSLLDIALTHGVQIECACGGQGVCGTCHVVVREGADHLSEAADAELDVLDEVPGSGLNSRLACRAVVRGDVTVIIPTRGRNLAAEKT